MSQRTSEMTLTKVVTVEIPVEDAFRLYTEGIATWWPHATHSVAAENVEEVVFEAREGGLIYERAKSGEEHLWGTVVACAPPSRIVHTWHPGRDGDSAQEVEITFEPVASGTRLKLVHTGWERTGEQAADMLANYDTGWDFVLGRYLERANA